MHKPSLKACKYGLNIKEEAIEVYIMGVCSLHYDPIHIWSVWKKDLRSISIHFAK